MPSEYLEDAVDGDMVVTAEGVFDRATFESMRRENARFLESMEELQAKNRVEDAAIRDARMKETDQMNAFVSSALSLVSVDPDAAECAAYEAGRYAYGLAATAPPNFNPTLATAFERGKSDAPNDIADTELADNIVEMYSHDGEHPHSLDDPTDNIGIAKGNRKHALHVATVNDSGSRSPARREAVQARIDARYAQIKANEASQTNSRRVKL